MYTDMQKEINKYKHNTYNNNQQKIGQMKITSGIDIIQRYKTCKCNAIYHSESKIYGMNKNPNHKQNKINLCEINMDETKKQEKGRNK